MMPKRHKRDLDICRLPDNVISEIMQRLEGNLGCKLISLSKQYRQELSPFVFDKLKIIWHDILDHDFQAFITRYKSIIKELRIIDSYAYGEYQIDVGKELLSKLRVRTLKINTNNSSYWLKYRGDPHVGSLELYHDGHHNETLEKFGNPNPKNINRLTSNNLPKSFDLHHLHQFGNLRALVLKNYQFNWQEPTVTPTVEKLTLIDCSWEYPFTLDQFNIDDSLTELHISYSHDNSFMISERFGKFLTHPLSSGLQLQKLSINFHHCTMKRGLTVNQFRIFINPHTFPKLTHLNLETWTYHKENIDKYLSMLRSTSVSTVCLDHLILLQ